MDRAWWDEPWFRIFLLGVAAVSFVLPFVHSIFETPGSTGPGAGLTIDRSGLELVVGKPWTDIEEVEDLARGFALDLSRLRQRIPPEPFGVIAFVSLVAAAVLAAPRLGMRTRSVAANWVAAGALSMIPISPSLAYVGLAVIEVQPAYWVALGLTIAALALAWTGRERSEVRTAPPPPAP